MKTQFKSCFTVFALIAFLAFTPAKSEAFINILIKGGVDALVSLLENSGSKDATENEHIAESLQKTLEKLNRMGHTGVINEKIGNARLNSNYSVLSFYGQFMSKKDQTKMPAVYSILMKTDPGSYEKFTDKFYVWTGADEVQEFQQASKRHIAKQFASVNIGPIEEEPAKVAEQPADVGPKPTAQVEHFDNLLLSARNSAASVERFEKGNRFEFPQTKYIKSFIRRDGKVSAFAFPAKVTDNNGYVLEGFLVVYFENQIGVTRYIGYKPCLEPEELKGFNEALASNNDQFFFENSAFSVENFGGSLKNDISE